MIIKPLIWREINHGQLIGKSDNTGITYYISKYFPVGIEKSPKFYLVEANTFLKRKNGIEYDSVEELKVDVEKAHIKKVKEFLN